MQPSVLASLTHIHTQKLHVFKLLALQVQFSFLNHSIFSVSEYRELSFRDRFLFEHHMEYVKIILSITGIIVAMLLKGRSHSLSICAKHFYFKNTVKY